jgi:mannosylglycerate hydrolase
LPFQAYRLRLVEMIGELLELLESEALPNFVLDGQTVLLEDYLVVRPQDRARICKLAESGKIKLGPWYTMPDCFLARPESLIRNLQRGLEMAQEHGGASRVGYVPDSFGHFAQLPQILAGFGIDSFLFMRGMPEEFRDSHGAIFTWRSPEGAEVLATFLREGYFPLGALGQESFHGRYDGLKASRERALERLSHTLARIEPFQKYPVAVLPAGGDHLPAREDLKSLIEHLNAHQSEIELRFGSFEDYLAELRTPSENRSFPVYSGDLLGQADHPLLRNVLSSRVDLKILNHRAQSLLTGVVEPLAAWASAHGLPRVEPALVQSAWDSLLKNHAHDDICGCSVDDVHLDDIQRFHEVLALGGEIINRQIEHIVQLRLPPLAHSRSVRVFAFNPHPWRVDVETDFRILLADDGGEFSENSEARNLEAVNAAGQKIQLRVLSTSCKAIRNRYLETTWGRAYDVHAQVSLPPLGFEILTVSETAEPLEIAQNSRSQQVPETLINAIRFELDVDIGDGYSYGPCPEIPAHSAQLLCAVADAQLPNVFHLTYELTGYTRIQREELACKTLHECLGPMATMTISVRAQLRTGAADTTSIDFVSSGVWELQISYTNIFSDSRLRVFVDPQHIAGAEGLGACHELIADGQAQWVAHPARQSTREIWDGPLAKPAYPGEKPYPVHHTNDGVVWAGSKAAVFCGGAGLHEFELVSSGTSPVPSVAFTLHRAVGFLSVRGGRIRSCQAGPQRATPDAQLQKKLEHVFAFGCAENVAPAMRLLRETLHPCHIQECPVVPVKTAANSDSSEHVYSASMFDVGSTPLQVMCLKPARGKGILLRLLNPTADAVSADAEFTGLPERTFNAVRVNLDESPRNPIAELAAQQTLALNFKPYEIQTWKIEPC